MDKRFEDKIATCPQLWTIADLQRILDRDHFAILTQRDGTMVTIHNIANERKEIKVDEYQI
jgi:hypothetical protein